MDHCEGLSRDGQSWIGAHAWTGIEARPLDWADKDLLWERRYSIPVTDAQYKLAMAYMEASIGVKYDYRGILGMVLRQRKMYSTDRMDCSQFMCNWLMAAGLFPLNVLPMATWMVSPEMLHLSSLFIGKCVYRFVQSKYS
jgi:hypothetical protein